MSEAEAIRLAQLGDAGAFEAFTGFIAGEFMRCGLRMVGNTSEAEDPLRMLSCNCSARSRHFWESRSQPGCTGSQVNVVLMKLRKENAAGGLRWRDDRP